MNCNHFGDPLSFHLVPLVIENLSLFSTLIYDQIPAKILAFPQICFVFSATVKMLAC